LWVASDFQENKKIGQARIWEETARCEGGSQADVPLAEAVSRLQARARPGALVADAL